MKPILRKTHLVTGLSLLVIFPLTGAYLRYRVPHLMEGSDRYRFSMRGNHIYILLSGLIHLALGVYFRQVTAGWLSKVQAFGSVLLLLSSVFVVAAFFFEPKIFLARPHTLSAMVLALTGMLLHAFCVLLAEVKSA